MKKYFLVTLLTFIVTCVKAQYIFYRENLTPPKAKPKPAPVKVDSLVFHQYPDKCPGQAASLPILTNYVPRDVVIRMNEKFKGHLYCMTSLRGTNGKALYKLKICEKGEFKFETVDENGITQ